MKFLPILLPFLAAAPLHAGGIFWTNRGASLVERSLYDGSGRTTVLAGAGSNVRGIALDLPNNRIYYNDNGGDVIYRMNADGTGRTTVASLGAGTSFPADIELHLAAGHLYYCDQQKAHIRRINADGTGGTTLITDATSQPYYLDLDLVNGKIYWGDFDGISANTGNVFRMNLNGSGPETVVTGNHETRAVCVDPAGGWLYWVNRNAGKIMRCPLAALPVNAASSPAVQTLYSSLDTPHGMVLDVPAGKVYWVDTATNNFPNTFGDRAVSRGDMDGSGPHEVLVNLGSEPWDVDVDPRCATYAEWVARFLRLNPGAASHPAADPDNDGVLNVTECALTLHPARPDAGRLPENITVSTGGQEFPALRYIRRTGTAKLRTLPQHSTDAQNWWDEESPVAGPPRLTIVSVTPLAEPNTEQVIVRSNFPYSAQMRQFLRVKAVLDP